MLTEYVVLPNALLWGSQGAHKLC